MISMSGAIGAAGAGVTSLSGLAFFISPGTNKAERSRSDTLCGDAQSATEDRNLEIKHWGDAAAPGSITVSIVKSIAEAPVVFADLTGRNPNVYYEVGLAHALGIPVIAFLSEDEKPAFDLSGERLIRVRIVDDEIIHRPQLRDAVRQALKAVESNGSTADTAVGLYLQGKENERLRNEVERLHSGQGEGAHRHEQLPRAQDLLQAARLGRLRRLRVDEVESGMKVVHIEYGLGEVVRFRHVGDGFFLTVRYSDGSTDSSTLQPHDRELDLFLDPL
jgi:hypothetical protein